MNTYRKRTEEEWRKAIASSKSLAGVIKYFGLVPAGGNFQKQEHEKFKKVIS